MAENNKVVAFALEIERLMIAYRIESGQLMWNADDIRVRDAVVTWARKYADQTKTDTLNRGYGKTTPAAPTDAVMEKMEAALRS